jgi:hypothetical protein
LKEAEIGRGEIAVIAVNGARIVQERGVPRVEVPVRGPEAIAVPAAQAVQGVIRVVFVPRIEGAGRRTSHPLLHRLR